MKTTTVESLLGVLSLGPMSGYQMRQFMDQSTGNFWNESFGQIYPALKVMLAEGLVEVVEDADGEGHPAKKIYRLTAKGEVRLQAWLGVPLQPHKARNELLLKVFFGNRAERGAVAAHVKARQARCASDLERYAGIQHKLESMHADEPGMPFWRMTVRYGISEARMILLWCEETLAELEKLDSESTERDAE